MRESSAGTGPVHVIGAGLAGSEAAWQLARRGVRVILHEMRPLVPSPAHKTAYCAELVCSNSLRAAGLENAVGLLKEELRRLGSLIMACADRHRVPAGGALAVDREGFAAAVTAAVKSEPLITWAEEEVTEPEKLEGTVIVASGPLTSPALAAAVARLIDTDYLHFYDAAAPIVSSESLDREKVFLASRYGKGEAAYLNCPFYSKEEYLRFREALMTAECAPLHAFEKPTFFEGCMPIEELARRGEDTMRFGPLKPVGLVDPRIGKEAYAVVQLRQDDGAASLYNIVGFQTHLKWPEQKRVFSLIPGLEQADFVRYGVMHRNTYLDSPRLLQNDYSLRSCPRFYFAGQLTGVEGYVESCASGLTAGVSAACKILGRPAPLWPRETAIGALARYVSNEAVTDFQPMNINFGLLPPLGYRVKGKREKNALISQRALQALEKIFADEGEGEKDA